MSPERAPEQPNRIPGPASARPGTCREPHARDDSHACMRIVALFVALLALMFTADTAAFGGGACATHNEYERIHEGMWRYRVTLVFGFVGDPGIHHDGITTRRYEGCKSGTAAYIDFRDRRVVNKTWVQQEDPSTRRERPSACASVS